MNNYNDLLNNLGDNYNKKTDKNQSPMWMINIDGITKAVKTDVKLADKAFTDFVPILAYSFKFSRDISTNSYYQIPSGALEADDLRFVVPIANLNSLFETSFINNTSIKQVTLARMLLSGSTWNFIDSFIFSECYIIAMHPSGDNMAAAIRYKTYQRKHQDFKNGKKSGIDAFGHSFVKGSNIKGK